MSLQVNVPLTTNSGLPVPSGSYVTISEERFMDKKYSIRAVPRFYINKNAFDTGLAPFTPSGLPENMFSFYQEFTASNYGDVSSLDVQTYVKDQFETLVGVGNITLVE